MCYVYRPPNSPVAWFNDFNTEIERADNVSNDIIIIGDVNVNFLCNHGIITNVRAKLNDRVQLNNLTQIVNQFTSVTPVTQTLIDHIYVKNVKHVQEVKVPKFTISDHHYAICLTWKKQGVNLNHGPSNLVKYRNMSDFSQEDFVSDLNMYMRLDVETESLEEVVSCMTNSFMEILDKHAPIKQKRMKHYVQPVWFTNDIKQRILARNREKRKGHFQQFKILRNEVVQMVRRAKSLHYHKIIENSKGNSKELWKHMRELTGKKSNKVPMAIKIDDE